MANGAYYVDQALTNLSQAWTNDSGDFIAEKLFPVLQVEKKTGKYWAYNKDNLRIPSSTLRTGRSLTREATFGKSLQDFGPLQEHAVKDFISKDEYDMTDAPLSVESDSVANLNEIMLLAEEQDLSTILSNTSIITNNETLSSTDQWSDYANSTPFEDIKARIIQMRNNALKPANTIAFSWDVWMVLQDHPDLLDRVKWSQLGVMTEELMIRLFAPYGITRVLVGKVMKNTAVEGQADSLGSVWGKHVWLAYITPTPGLRTVNGGYTLRLRGGKYVDRWDERDPKGTYIRNNDYYDQVLFNADLFALIKDAVA
jgi:hypothetical protein